MTLLDIANYGLFSDAGAFLVTLGKVFLGGLGILFGGVALTILFVISLLAIVFFSVRRGMRYRSVPKTVGAFFRLTGIAIGAFVALFVLPIVGVMFSVSFLKLLLAFAVMVTVGYLIGRIASAIIGLRLRRYAVYVRTADYVHGRVVRIVRGL